ncbi:hypothetical protein Glov_3513 [Trichlorobacter lovleyi SZ]|uniref:Uncharacterized protein n=1 Tax=Trichlorobacter lovleyi (strain ATCC BAA-1151 / DSM 17278 / SZ) TaxID=398767 RepID=B3E2V6_TRIL1|nr:hypothetical protein Glov_3513 [Trichlorobacter lovleyi SZ]
MRSWWRNGTGFDCAQPAEPQPPPELVRNRSLSAVEGSIQRDCPSSRSLSAVEGNTLEESEQEN